MSSNGGAEQDGAAEARLDPLLRRMVAEHPDSVVGVLVRTSAPAQTEERRALEGEGLVIGTVAGAVVTGRIRAGSAPALARLPFVVYIEAAKPLRPLHPQTPAPRSD